MPTKRLLLVCCLFLGSCSRSPDSVSSSGKPGAGPAPPPTTEEKAVETLGASVLFQEYASAPATAESRYTDKIVQIKGPVKTFSMGGDPVCVQLKVDTDPTEQRHIRCFFDARSKPELENLRIGDRVEIKGRCKGKEFNHLRFEDCKLVRVEKS